MLSNKVFRWAVLPPLIATLSLVGCDKQSPTAVENQALEKASLAKNSAAPSVKVKAPTKEFVEETFVDYGVPSHAGPGPHPTTESSDFKLTQGGISWFSSSTVKYEITGTEGATGGNTAIESAVATWDGFVTTRTFTKDNSSPSTNPCGGVNAVRWAAIDGSGGVLATASVCRTMWLLKKSSVS